MLFILIKSRTIPNSIDCENILNEKTTKKRSGIEAMLFSDGSIYTEMSLSNSNKHVRHKYKHKLYCFVLIAWEAEINDRPIVGVLSVRLHA